MQNENPEKQRIEIKRNPTRFNTKISRGQNEKLNHSQTHDQKIDSDEPDRDRSGITGSSGGEDHQLRNRKKTSRESNDAGKEQNKQ